VLAKLDILPGPLNAKVLRYLTGSTSRVAVSLPPIMLLGTTVAVAGTALRTSAFRALGRHFTFELSLKKDHTLVTTFPYNIVRHPSYLGGWIAIAGLGLTHTTRDGWVRAVLIPRGSGMDSTLEKAMCGAIAAAFTLMLAMSFSRISVEDAMLRARFGQEWEDWARRVPYKLVPYIW
jgi:protein-S-isoprenylcysteine O-methyltransferase Ste14